MSLNSALNAVIALLEGRPSVAKDILRNPLSDIKNVPEVLTRLNSALDRHTAAQVRKALIECLRIQPDSTVEFPLEERDAFFQGVRAVEELFEKLVAELEA